MKLRSLSHCVSSFVCRTRALVVAAASVCIALTPASAQTAQPAAAHLQPDFGKIPLSFEPNRGQQSGGDFMAHGQGYALALSGRGARLSVNKAGSKHSTLSMELLGTKAPAGAGQDLLPGTANYFIGNDHSQWQTNLPTYGRVSYNGVYPGIDLVYYGNQRQLEYDFIVAPGADPRRIALAFSGATARIDRAGDLVLPTSTGDVCFHKPVVYQNIASRRVPVQAQYTLARGEVRFALGAYDHTQPLVIDPVLSYLSYFGGSNNDLTNGLAVDSAGNTYVVGTTSSVDFPTKNPFQASSPGLTRGTSSQAMFVSKFNSTGTALVYSTFLGSVGNVEGWGIAVDGSGNAYVVGDTDTGDYPITAGAFQTLCGGNYGSVPNSNQVTRVNGCVGAGQGDNGGVLTKLNASGTALVYSTYLSGNNYNSARVVAVDAAGEAYVAGITNSQCNMGSYGLNGTGYQSYDCYPTTSGAAQAGVNVSTGGGTRLFSFFSKLDAAGANMLYSTLLGPNNFNVQSGTHPLAIAIDPAGLAYVSGYTSYNLFTTSGSYQPTAFSGNNQYGYVAKFDPTAQRLVYSTYVTGPKGSQPYVAADAAGNAYLAGNTTDCSYPTTAGAYQTQARFPVGATANCNAGFVTKLNPTGTALVWSTFVGNDPVNGESVGLDAIALGSDGSIYVGGNGSSGGYPLLNPLQQTQSNYYQYPVISRLNSSGTALLFSTVISGTTQSSDNVTGIAVDGPGNIYIAGTTNSATLPTTPGVFQAANTKSGGYYAGFIAKIAPTVTTTTTLTLPTSVTAGQSAKFSAKVTGPTGTTTIPTGTITFVSGSSTLGTGTLDATGTATYTATSLNATTYNVAANYSGDSTFSVSTSGAQALVVAPAVATLALTAPATAAPGASVTVSVKVSGSGGTPTGTITFKDGSATLSTATLASGVASYTSTAFALGAHSLSASYTGDSIFGAATSSAQTLTISLSTPTVTLAAPATALVGSSVLLSATVAGASGTPTGSVIFKDGSAVLSTVPLASGAATYTTSSLALGAHTITAAYSGDAAFSAVTSTASTVTINVAATVSFAIAPTTLTIVHGSSGTTVLTGTPAGGYTGPASFACGMLPTAASCSFSPATLTFNGSNTAQTSTLTFSTLSTTAQLERGPLTKVLGGVALALLLWPFSSMRRRKGNLLRNTLLSLFGIVAVLGLGSVTGCSSGTPFTTSTPAGTYTVPVTVTAGATTSTLNLTVTVQ